MSDEIPRLTKREWDSLGRLLLPVTLGGKITLGPKIAGKLESLDLVEPFEQEIPASRPSPPWMRVKIQGYRMTPRGHRLY
ncbi:MAG TPA: hypothetical protein VIU12_11310, partial [Chryseolinea sp.]